MTPATPPPTLEELAQTPGGVVGLPPAVIYALLARCALVQGVLIAQLLRGQGQDGGHGEPAQASDRLLPPSEAAALLGVTTQWLYRHAGRLPFTRRLSRKVLRFSEAGLRRWQASRGR